MIKSILSLFNLDIFIEPMSLSNGPFSFYTETTSCGIWGVSREWWGLGLHIIISPLRMPPQ